VALESIFDTCRLRESVKGHLRLIDVTLSQPTPGVVELITKLSTVLTSDYTLPTDFYFTTKAAGSTAAIFFEVDGGDVITRSDQVGYCYGDDGGSFTDHTAAARDVGTTFNPWGATPEEGDALYIGHDDVLVNRLDLVVPTAGDIWGDDDHAWEYYDGGTEDATPDSVTDLGGGSLKIVVDALLGTNDRHGAQVTVKSLITGAEATVASEWDGSNNHVDPGYLLQASPSTEASDYLVGAAWKELADVVETVDGSDRVVSFTLPETTDRQWQPTAVDGTTAYWIRLRVINDQSNPTVFQRTLITEGDQYVKHTATQGQTVTDDPAASATGLASQEVPTSRPEVIEGTLSVTVDEGSGPVDWVEVENFLSSASTDRHYTVDFDEDGRATVTFGDGNTGKIPPQGVDNIAIVYRVGAETSGNVGANAVTENRSGVAILANVTNPRPGAGWVAKDGYDATDLERVKVAGPASLRTRDRAVTGADCEELAQAWVADDGTSPVVRAKAFEDYYGPKTVRLIVVGAGGGLLPQATLDELELYFNGSPQTDDDGVLIMNHELTAENFVPVPIVIDATTTGGDQDTMEAVMAAYLSPVAQDDDGNYEHEIGGTVYRSKLISVIFDSDDDVEDVTLTDPASNVNLNADELPTNTARIDIIPS
jgi:predicted phage baseplate assembly protein